MDRQHFLQHRLAFNTCFQRFACNLTPTPLHPQPPPSCQIYDAAVKKVPEKERLSVYDVYVARASEFFGIGKVRASIVRAASCCLLCCRQPFACAGAAAQLQA